MRVLVTAASRHGATGDIADAIGENLSGYGITVEVLPPEEIAAIDAFDAVILGSAVYMGHWLPGSRRFATRFAADLRTMPVWIFSSGPVGNPPKPMEEPEEIAAIVAAVGAREHRMLPGALDERHLSLRERLVMRVFKAPQGDYRDWPAIKSWSATIAHSLLATAGKAHR